MRLLDHVTRCNSFDPADYCPFLVAGHSVGALRPALADRLGDFPAVFRTTAQGIHLAETLTTAEARTEAMAEIARPLTAAGILPPPLGELYRVVRRWGDTPLLLLDRAFVPFFGITAFGVHVNGYVDDGRGLRLWVAERSADRRVEPGKLDNVVAGGQPAGLGLMDNLVKEAFEEAGMPRDLALQARPAGAVSYCMATPDGLKPDVMFVYDIALPADFRPVNTDGEVGRFHLMEPAEILAILTSGQRFKFNVPLVLIDFFIRHGILSADTEPDYHDLVHGLRATGRV
jgi:8-oxo-dGTP pyrophosphatase MutT (NUDIX family)